MLTSHPLATRFSENFSEYMHLPSVHPALCDVSPVDKHKRCQVTAPLPVLDLPYPKCH